MFNEIALERGGVFAIVKCDDSAEVPGAEPRRMGDGASVVMTEAVGQIVGEAGVVPVGVGFALQDVDVRVSVHGLPGRSSAR